LRYYHAEGLVVPAEVNEQTGYRGYTFDQVHRALLVVAVRGAGIGVRAVRDLLESPDRLPAVLHEHRAALEWQRGQQDNAMARAWQLAEGWPTAHERDQPPTTAVVRRVPGSAVGSDGVVLPPETRAAAETLQRELKNTGVQTSGPVWCQYALETSEDKAKVLSLEGPDWTVAVEIATGQEATPVLPTDTGLLNCPARRERVVPLGEPLTMIVFAAAIEYLSRTSLDQCLVPDLGRPRYVFHDDHVELALAVTPA